MKCAGCSRALDPQASTEVAAFPGSAVSRCRECGTINVSTDSGPQHVIICDACASPYASSSPLSSGREICPKCLKSGKKVPGFLVPLMDRLSRAQEIRMGEEACAKIIAGKSYTTSGPTVAWLTDRLRLLGQESPRPELPYRIILVEDKDPNALSIPGGIVIVNTGLLDFIETEGEILFVLAHEVSHICLRHGLLNLEHQEKMAPIRFISNLALLFFTGGSALFLIPFANMLMNAQSLGYGRKHESEADREGMRLMLDIGYDPRYAKHFFDRLEQLQPSSHYATFLASHPSPEDRRQGVAQFLRGHPVESALLKGERRVGSSSPGRMQTAGAPATPSPAPERRGCCGGCSCCGCSSLLLILVSIFLLMLSAC